MSIAIYIGATVVTGLAMQWHASRRRRQEKEWSIGGVSVRAHKSQLSLEERRGRDTNQGWVSSHPSIVEHIRFDDKGLVKDVYGTSVEGPLGCFKAGQPLKLLQKKLGRPDREDSLSVRYFLSGIALDVSLFAQDRSLITGFHLAALYGRDAVEAESVILAKRSS